MPIMTVILSQQFWQMKAKTDQHNTIQNTFLATILRETKVSVIKCPTWKQNGKKTKSVKSCDEIIN